MSKHEQKKLGRPFEMEDGEYHSFRGTSEQWEKAIRIGGGRSGSKGVRMAIDAYQENDDGECGISRVSKIGTLADVEGSREE